jgi:hypothetical protein
LEGCPAVAGIKERAELFVDRLAELLFHGGRNKRRYFVGQHRHAENRSQHQRRNGCEAQDDHALAQPAIGSAAAIERGRTLFDGGRKRRIANFKARRRPLPAPAQP